MERHFDEQLRELLRRLVAMGALAEAMIERALRSLVERKGELHAEVYAKEEEVNALQIAVDEEAITLTALHQPVGTDLRFLFMVPRITAELERIADQAVNICQNTGSLLKAPPLKPLVDLPIMAEVVRGMVRRGIDALVNRDVAALEQVFEDEKRVDAFRDQIFRELLTYMMSDPGSIQRALALILISRNLEKIGDHVTNIAEEVIYLVQGRDVRHHHEEKERSDPPEGAEPTVSDGDFTRT